MDKILKILFVEDVKADAELIWREIEKNNIVFEKLLVDKKKEFLKALNSYEPDIIISDYSLPKFDGMTAILLRNEIAPLTPFILVTGSVNEEVAVECMKAGADDYILKGSLSRIGHAIVNSLNKIKLLEEKNSAVEELRKSEERFRHITSTISDISYSCKTDQDGNYSIEWMIGATERITGYAIDEIMRMNCWGNLVVEEDKNLFLKHVTGLIPGSSDTCELRLLKKSGEIVWVESFAECLANDEGTWHKILFGALLDITERKLAEKALQESEEKYRRIFENIQDVYYETSIDGTVNAVSPSISILSRGQYSQSDLVGKSMYDFYSNPLERQAIVAALKENGAVPDFVIELMNRDGSSVPCSISAKLSLDAQRRPEKIIGSMRDISERKKAEDELKESAEFNNSLLQTIPFGMDIVDEAGIILFQNDNFKRLFGKEAIGKKCWELYRDDRKQCSDCPLIKGIRVGETEAYESNDVLGGRIFEINHTGTTYKGKKAMLEIFQDITDRKINEYELVKSKEKAEESDRLKTAFLHNISHEIRTPMNAIVGFSTLLGEPDIDALSRQSYIELIMQSSNHLLAIITDIVDIANIEANLVKTSKTGINVNSTLKTLCDQFRLRTDEKKLLLTCENALENSEAFILTDSTKLSQILSNLISNALKFTNDGEIKVEYKVKDNFLEFSVSDTGIGIPGEYHERIFDRFYQVQNAVSRLYEGTGLGLAISKAYVELLGGKMWLASEPGKGTTFLFTIPYEKQVVEHIAVQEKRTPEGFVFPVRKTILVAEDIDSNFKLINYFLSGANTRIIRATNGKEAVEKASNGEKIDLILMDIKMPVMDGYTAVKLIREANIKIPIVAQTAYADDKFRAIECGCNGFISKPFDRKSLIRVLCEFI